MSDWNCTGMRCVSDWNGTGMSCGVSQDASCLSGI